VDIAAIVSNACELFRPTAEDKKISLACNASETHFIMGDHRLIQRMIANLLDNAIKYTPASGRIDVSVTTSSHEQAVISIKDTGEGISQKDLSRIFERFYRCDQSRSQEGVGLGLSLALAIARAHGGDIAAVSQPKKGSIFTVMLPKSAKNRHVVITRDRSGNPV
jgi:signal transduction histidine kinase